jgi:hypothetical protein
MTSHNLEAKLNMTASDELPQHDHTLRLVSIVGLVCYILVALCACQPFGHGPIDVSMSDEPIVDQVQRFTPLGSDAAQVLEVIHSRFRDDGMISGIGIVEQFSWNGGASIELPIGHKMKRPPSVEVVAAIWEFDSYRILRKIKVRHYISKASSLDFGKRAPVIPIDPYWPDSKIKEELLRYSPIGTPFRKVNAPERLHFGGGPANPGTGWSWRFYLGSTVTTRISASYGYAMRPIPWRTL